MSKVSCIVFFAFMLFACGNEKRGERTGSIISLDFSLDTVMVDPGDEILYVTARLSQSELSSDQKYLYNFNQQDYTFEQIDLNELRLVRKYAFEKEGPNGIGQFFRSFFLIDDSHFMIQTFPKPGVFDLNGRKLRELDFNNFGKDKDGIQDGEFFHVSAVHPTIENQYLGFVQNFKDRSTELMRVDLNEDVAKRISIPPFEHLSQFELQFSDGQSFSISRPAYYLVQAGGKILLSSEISNELCEYLSELDSVVVKTYQSQLTENKKTGPAAKELESQEAYYEAVRQIREQVNFSPPVWDNLHKVYYRFSHKEIFKEITAGSNQYPEAEKAEVFLTVFDENLEMLSESKIAGLSLPPEKHFVKDGKIWMFVNVNDEMGFARLSVSGL